MEEWCEECDFAHEQEGDIVDVICDCAKPCKAVVKGEHGRLLQWHCTFCGDRQDVNA